MKMKRLLSCIIGSAITLSSVSCSYISSSDIISTSSKMVAYTLDVATIASVLPNVRSDIDTAYTTIEESGVLTKDDNAKIENSKKLVYNILDGLDTLISAKDIKTVLVSATKLEEYVGLSRAIYSDMYSIVDSHRDELSSVDKYKLKQFDTKMRGLDEAYNNLVESNIGSIDVTSIVTDVLSLVRASLAISELTMRGNIPDVGIPKEMVR